MRSLGSSPIARRGCPHDFWFTEALAGTALFESKNEIVPCEAGRYARHMDAYEVVRRLDEWVREVMVDERTGVPPDAKLDIKPSSSSRMGGVRTRGFNLELRFAPNETDETIEAVAPLLQRAVKQDPTLGRRFAAGTVELAGDRLLEDSDDPEARGVTVRVRVSERDR
jgi:hypothetical protein